MARNIIFIVLFVVLYGGLILFGCKGNTEIIDRGGYGEFTETGYSCEACSFDMEFDPSWIAMDGTSVANDYTDSELYEYFGDPDSYDFILGFIHPDIYMECVRFNDYTMDKKTFTNSYLTSELDYYKDNVANIGGVMNSSGYKVLQANGNGTDMGVYYYDYTMGGEFYSEFNCFFNSGKDTIWIYGYYENTDCLQAMFDLVENKLTVNSDASTTV